MTVNQGDIYWVLVHDLDIAGCVSRLDQPTAKQRGGCSAHHQASRRLRISSADSRRVYGAESGRDLTEAPGDQCGLGRPSQSSRQESIRAAANGLHLQSSRGGHRTGPELSLRHSLTERKQFLVTVIGKELLEQTLEPLLGVARKKNARAKVPLQETEGAPPGRPSRHRQQMENASAQFEPSLQIPARFELLA